jgi:hypothetical protein
VIEVATLLITEAGRRVLAGDEVKIERGPIDRSAALA